ncbi:MAG: ECF transporter S component [Bacillota bacterium]
MKLTVRKMAVAGLLGAVSLVMGFVPALGLIPVPTPAQHATILHVPAILAGIAEGPVVGMVVGLIFGIISLTRATIPAFADPLVAILPRLFIGVLAAYAFAGIRRYGLTAALVGSAVVGTLTNTVLVLSMMVLRGYLPASAAVGVGILHGTPEVVVAAVICAAVGSALYRAGYIPQRENRAA